MRAPPRVRLLAALLPALVLPAPPAAAEALGRLFFTPERRAALDRQRQYNIQETRTIQGGSLQLDGIVRRSSGRTTVWVNGVAQNERSDSAGVAVRLSPREPGAAAVSAGDEAPAELRVGESVNRGTRETAELLRGGTIRRRASVEGH